MASAGDDALAFAPFIPASLSAQTRTSLKQLIERLAQRPARVLPGSPAAFASAAAAREAEAQAWVERNPDVIACTVSEVSVGGTPALEIIPPIVRETDSALVYVHGGAFVTLSARSTLPVAARLARVNQRRVISIDYTLAPVARWRTITGQVLAAVEALIVNGLAAARIGVVGDSAGGAIATSALLQMCRASRDLPGALVLMSTVADLTLSGDTVMSLGDADLVLDVPMLRHAYAAYAEPIEHALPEVSPALMSFPPNFPPTLLQVGTRELLLSDSIRLAGAIEHGRGQAQLRLYEGMPHSFHVALSQTIEAERAYAEQAHFIARTLDRSRRRGKKGLVPERTSPKS